MSAAICVFTCSSLSQSTPRNSQHPVSDGSLTSYASWGSSGRLRLGCRPSGLSHSLPFPFPSPGRPFKVSNERSWYQSLDCRPPAAPDPARRGAAPWVDARALRSGAVVPFPRQAEQLGERQSRGGLSRCLLLLRCWAERGRPCLRVRRHLFEPRPWRLRLGRSCVSRELRWLPVPDPKTHPRPTGPRDRANPDRLLM